MGIEKLHTAVLKESIVETLADILTYCQMMNIDFNSALETAKEILEVEEVSS